MPGTLVARIVAVAAVVSLPGFVAAQPGQTPPTPPTPLTPAEQELLERGEIEQGEIVAGGLVGTFFGLGLGHAIQGRYLDRGWIFTVGEVASFTVAVAGAASCIDDGPDCSGMGVFVAGFVSLLGFRVWELIDIWAAPGQHNRRVRAIRQRQTGVPAPAWSLTLQTAQDDGRLFGVALRF